MALSQPTKRGEGERERERGERRGRKRREGREGGRRRQGRAEEREGGRTTTTRGAAKARKRKKAREGGNGKAIPKFIPQFVTYYKGSVLDIFSKGVGITKRNGPDMMKNIASKGHDK